MNCSIDRVECPIVRTISDDTQNVESATVVPASMPERGLLMGMPDEPVSLNVAE
jgi:hypothetical protein